MTPATGLVRPYAVLVWAGLVGLLAAVLLAVSAGPADAHASLADIRPADRSSLTVAPSEVVLTFTEPVEVPSGGIRVLDATATRVDLGAIDTGDPAIVGVALPADLPDGAYMVSYRVISADSHPVGGVRTFTVGDAEEVPAEVLAGVSGDGPRAVARRIGQVLRGVGYLATLLATGMAAARWLVVRRPGHRGAARRIAVRAALAAVALALVALPVQAVAVTGDPAAAWSALALWETATSSFGVATILRAALLAVLALLLVAALPPALPALVGAAGVATLALDGHQRSVEPTWLLITGDLLHVGAAAVWFGGLVLVGVILARPTSRSEPAVVAGVLDRFSTIAVVSMGLVALAGVAMARPLVGSPAALVSTAYGRLLLVKLGAVAVILAVAAYNRFRLVPAMVAAVTPAGAADPDPLTEELTDAAPASSGAPLPDDALGAAWSGLVRTVRIEVGLVVAVLLVTGFLATTAPAATAAGFGGIHQATVALGEELELELVVDPNAVGLNTLHLYVLDATGRPSTAVEDLRFELTFVPAAIGPIVITPFAAGPGHWIATIDDLSLPGPWEVRVVAGLDRFTEVETTVTVTVADR